MKRYIPYMPLPLNLYGRSSWSTISNYALNLRFLWICETCGNFVKIWYLQGLQFESKIPFANVWHASLWSSALHHIAFLHNRFLDKFCIFLHNFAFLTLQFPLVYCKVRLFFLNVCRLFFTKLKTQNILLIE